MPPEDWYLSEIDHHTEVDQKAGAHSRQVGRDYLDSRDYRVGSQAIIHQGADPEQLIDYAQRKTAPLEANIKKYRQNLVKAQERYSELTTENEKIAKFYQLARRLLLAAILLILILILGLIVVWHLRDPSSQATSVPSPARDSEPNSEPPPQSRQSSKVTASDVNNFLLAYYRDTRDGGLSKVSVLDTYFPDRFYWYGDGDDGGKPIKDKAAFAEQHRKTGIDTSKCRYFPASATKVSVAEDGRVIVDAIIPWISETKSTSGVVTDRYKLDRISESPYFRIYVVVDNPRDGQRSC